jgi:hypothetical protein
MQPSAGYSVQIPAGGVAEVYLRRVDKDTSRSGRSIPGRDHNALVKTRAQKFPQSRACPGTVPSPT